MSMEAPPLDKRNADRISAEVEEALKAWGWQGQKGEAGWAMARLFSRLSELTINRLNQVPDKHFLAFLNAAGVDLLAPRPASVEISFGIAEDGPALIRVPAGTQVATLQTETQPEIIFETQDRVSVVRTQLVSCIAFDPRDYADRTAQARGEDEGAFPVFRGQRERGRTLYLGDQELFGFADDASREAATITLSFEFDLPGGPEADGWELEWLYWDGTGWRRLVDAGSTVTDGTHNFSMNGRVQFKQLPAIAETEIGGQAGPWLACRLTGGTERKYLPVLRGVQGSRRIEMVSSQPAAVDAALNAIQANTAMIPLDTSKDFFPFGQLPQRLDAFYLMSDEGFSKTGATVSLEIVRLSGVAPDASSPDLEALTIIWEYYSSAGWTTLGTSTRTGVTSARLGFDDQTLAFTQGGDGQESHHISFTVPVPGGPDPVFEKRVVNDQEGYWIRARISAGSYNVPALVDIKNRLTGSYEFTEPKSYAPLITELKVAYTGFRAESPAMAIQLCRSEVDSIHRDHSADLARGIPVQAFSAKEEGPALYVGFDPGFPPETWIQLLLDVEERTDILNLPPTAVWEYWNGTEWSALAVSDDSQALKVRGYLGFFAPEDHQASIEFGKTAYWLRARPHQQPPLADAGSPQAVTVADGQATLTLDASRSQAFTLQHIYRYTWRLVSSRPPVANAGGDRTVTTPTFTLDASGSQGTDDRPLVTYTWRIVETRPAREEERKRSVPPTATPYLRTIRPNTIPAINALTVRDEILGSSNGSRDQVFTLVNVPVHPDSVQIAVREPDRPPEEELRQLEDELQGADKDAQAVLSPPEVTPAWVRWHQVPDFFDSKADSRHFVLDPATGQVRFGDGQRGMIPPPGNDNIQAVRYRAHDGAAGNVAAGSVTVLRDPNPNVADISAVTNPEAAAGGSDRETVAEVKQRGPQTLKHRHQAVTQGGFGWLAREATSQVARAFCLPARNPLGLVEPGYVTVIIIPKSDVPKPTPSPALLRWVRQYLGDRALTNLTSGFSHIYLKGPDYIEATVVARVIPKDPAHADEVELAVLERLNTFLNPLKGGPERAGWEQGRNVYLSEIYAEIEAVPGVDHAVQAGITGSMRQQRLYLKQESALAPFDLPADSQVSTFDKRIKLLLADTILKGDQLSTLDVYDFKVTDKVSLVGADNVVLVDDLTIAALSGDSVTFAEPFTPRVDLTACDALLSADQRLRLPLIKDGLDFDAQGTLVGVTLQGLRASDRVSVIAYDQRDPRLELLPIKQVDVCRGMIFVPKGHLVYPGSHDIQMVLE
jgi:hypothetical protein